MAVSAVTQRAYPLNEEHDGYTGPSPSLWKLLALFSRHVAQWCCLPLPAVSRRTQADGVRARRRPMMALSGA